MSIGISAGQFNPLARSSGGANTFGLIPLCRKGESQLMYRTIAVHMRANVTASMNKGKNQRQRTCFANFRIVLTST
jgi:hypothetical protein